MARGGENERKHYSRHWLNEAGHHGNGYIVTELSSGPNHGDTGIGWVTGDVVIADCSRTIHLDFYMDADRNKNYEAERDNDLAKLDLLISELQEFRKVMRREVRKVKPKVEE